MCACKPCHEAVFGEGETAAPSRGDVPPLVMAVTKSQGALALEGMASSRSKQPYFQWQELGFWTSRQREVSSTQLGIYMAFSLRSPHLGQGALSPIFSIFIFEVEICEKDIHFPLG